MLDTDVAVYISELNKRLAKAAKIAKAADACSSAGSCDAAMEVAMNIDQLLYESDDTADGSQSDAAHSKEQQPLNKKCGAILKIAQLLKARGVSSDEKRPAEARPSKTESCMVVARPIIFLLVSPMYVAERPMISAVLGTTPKTIRVRSMMSV